MRRTGFLFAALLALVASSTAFADSVSGGGGSGSGGISELEAGVTPIEGVSDNVLMKAFDGFLEPSILVCDADNCTVDGDEIALIATGTNNRLLRRSGLSLLDSTISCDGTDCTVVSGKLNVQGGSTTVPGLQIGAANYGWSQVSTLLIAVVNGATGPLFTATSISIGSNAGRYTLGVSNDVVFAWRAANSGALRNTTSAQTFSVYETYTDDSNFELGSIRMGGDKMTIGPETAGSGQDNMSIDLVVTGSGTYNLVGNATQAAELRLFEDTDAGSNYSSFKNPALAASIDYTLPPDDGDAGERLQTNGSGVLTWEASLKTLTFVIGADTGAVLADTDDQATVFWNRSGAKTITEIACESDAGTPSINVARDDGSAANVLSSNLSCSTSGATSTTFTGGETALATGDKLDFVMATAGGAAKRVSIAVTYTE